MRTDGGFFGSNYKTHQSDGPDTFRRLNEPPGFALLRSFGVFRHTSFVCSRESGGGLCFLQALANRSANSVSHRDCRWMTPNACEEQSGLLRSKTLARSGSVQGPSSGGKRIGTGHESFSCANRILFQTVLVFVSIWFLSAFCVGPVVAAEKPETPNIVLIISDDQAWTDYGFMGHPNIKTPHLDKLSSESVWFDRGYVPTALCRPSLMTLATGHYAHRHGVTGNDPSPKYADPNSELYRERRAKLISYIDRFETLPELLAERGYLTHQSGKWWEGSFRQGGFTHGMTRGFPERGGRHGDDGLAIGREGMKPAEEFVEMAIAKEKPFFLWYAPFLPHSPHNPPERLLHKYKTEGRSDSISKYFAMCEWFDETCGQLIGFLEAKGVRDKTLIVYVTDNGWIQDPQGNGYAPRSKQTPYEGGIRTPILFSWPGRLKPAKRSELASSIDLVPTILAAAGARIPEGLPGLNLYGNLLTGEGIDREAIFGESFAHDIADITKPEVSLLYRWCIEGRWKLLLTYDGEVNRYASTHPRDEKRPQLFDLIADPGETRNLAREHPDLVARLAARITGWWPVAERKTVLKFE